MNWIWILVHLVIKWKFILPTYLAFGCTLGHLHASSQVCLSTPQDDFMWHAYVIHELDVQCLWADTRTSPSLPFFPCKLAIFPSSSDRSKTKCWWRVSSLAMTTTAAFPPSQWQLRVPIRCRCASACKYTLLSVPMANCLYPVCQMFLPSNLLTYFLCLFGNLVFPTAKRGNERQHI